MNEKTTTQKAFIAGIALISACVIFLIYMYFNVVRAPGGTSYPVQVVVENGQTIGSVARELRERGLIKSVSFAQHLMVASENGKKIKAGIYLFESPMGVFGVTERIIRGDFGYVPVKVTIPEGANSRDIARIMSAKLPEVNAASSTFLGLAGQHEGYLFPETYFFRPGATSTEVLERMEDMFKSKTGKLQEEGQTSGQIASASASSTLSSYGHSFADVIIVASILEKEVQTTEDRKIVADIIYRRLKLGMPLQIDATLAYVLGKTSAEMTLKDLRSDNPYNTYTRKGLPPTPISNPGLDAILAALEPEPNEYLFYLSDKDGITHFSKTHEEHVKLKAQYLK